jgi:hypothetical protein
MIKPFELFQKVLMVLAFWSVVLLIIHLKDFNGSWKLMLLNYFTDIMIVTFFVSAISTIFFFLYRQDEKKIRGRFKPENVDGFDINIGNYLRQTPLVQHPESCQALDKVHEFFIPMEALVRKESKKSKSEDEMNRELIESQEQEKNTKALGDNDQIIALEEKIKLLSAQISDAIDANRKLESNETADKKLSEEKLTELKSKKLSAEEIEDVQAIIKSHRKEIANLQKQTSEDGTMAYANVEKIDTKSLDTDSASPKGSVEYKGLLYYRDIFEQLWNNIPNTPDSEGNIPRYQCQEYLTRILEAVPEFKYEGITSTTPKIKKLDTFNIEMKDYQLTIFTALFPYLKWLQFRENTAMLQMELHDKRILLNARNFYEIYKNRDVNLKKGIPSSFTVPLKEYKNKELIVSLDESVALVELARFASAEQIVVLEDPVDKRKDNLNRVTEQEMIKLISDLLLQEDRLNGANRDKRIGMLAGGMLYLNWAEFIMQVKVEFMRSYPQHAKNLKTMEYVVFDLFRRRDFLGMEIANKENPLEPAKQFMNGQLFKVRWLGGKATDSEITTDGILVVKARRSFKPLNTTQSIKKATGIPQIIGLDDDACVANSEYAKELNDIKKAKRMKEKEEKEKAKAVEEANKEITQLSADASKRESANEIVKSSVSVDSITASLLESAKSVTAEQLAEAKDDKATNSKPKSKDSDKDDHDKGSGGTGSKQDPVGQAVEVNEPTETTSTLSTDDNLSLFSELTPVETNVDMGDLGEDQTPKANIKKKKTPPPAPKAKKQKIEPNPIADAMEIQRFDTVVVPDDERGEIVEVREADSTKTAYFAVNEKTHAVSTIPELTKKQRTQVVRVYFDTLRTNILDNESRLSDKRIEPANTTETYWEFSREQIIKHIPVSMQFHLLKQQKIENLYELRVAQKKEGEADILREKVLNEQTELKAIGRIRSLQLVRVYKSPEIAKYAPMQESDWDENRATRLMSQLEQAFFKLRKEQPKSVEFYKTSSSTWSYGVYRILSANLGLLGNLASQFQDFIAYKEQFKNLPKESGLKRAYKAMYCFTDVNNKNTVYSFYPPKNLSDNFEEEIRLANLSKSETMDLFGGEVDANDTVHANAIKGNTAIEDQHVQKAVSSVDLAHVPDGESFDLEVDESALETQSIDLGDPVEEEPIMVDPSTEDIDGQSVNEGSTDLGDPPDETLEDEFTMNVDEGSTDLGDPPENTEVEEFTMDVDGGVDLDGPDNEVEQSQDLEDPK